MATTVCSPLLRVLVALAVLTASATSPAAEVTLVPGTDLMGGDYKGFALRTAEPDACRQACAGDDKCKAYTYVNPGVKGPSAMCFLKATVPPSSNDACCTSGTKILATRIVPALAPPAPAHVLHLMPPMPCATLHVDVEALGNNQHDGSSKFPFATINAAIASANARKCSLDIVLAPGMYVEDIAVEADFKLKGADKASSRIQGSLRAHGDFQTVLWDIGFEGAPLAIYKEGGKIEMLRVAVSDIKFDANAGIASPGAVQIVNASGVVSGLVAEDVSSPALLVQGPLARIKAVALAVSDSEPAAKVDEQLHSVGAVEIRDHAAVMGSLWKIFDNQLFGVVVTTGASLYLTSAVVTNTFQQVGAFGPDNLLVASGGILEIDQVSSTGAGRAGALAASAYFTAHHSKLQSNKIGFVNVANDMYTDPTASARCATEDDVLLTGNSADDIVTGFGGSLAVPNAPLCVPGKEDQPACAPKPPPDFQACKLALRW